MVRRVVILGAPGAGKGTQARRLVESNGWAHISTGDIFRAHVEAGTPIGRKFEEYMKNGQLLPDDLVCTTIAARLFEEDCSTGYLLDGFPRTIGQAEAFDDLLAGRNESLDLVLNLEVSDEDLVDRLTNRRTCPVCGRIYNLKFKPPKVDEQCDNAACEGAKLVQRDDDQEQTIRNRLAVYHENTEPLISYYGKKGILRNIDGASGSPKDVGKRVEAVLSDLATTNL